MRSILLCSVFLFTASSAPVRAESQDAESGVTDKVASVRRWFANWAKGLKRSAVESRYRNVRTSAVAAVRGSRQDSNPDLPYWKGTWSDKKAAERMAERAELEAVVELALTGDIAGAQAALSKFEKQHPKSTLLEDVKEARAQLAALQEETAPAAAEGEKPKAEEPKSPEPKAAAPEAENPAAEAPKPEAPSAE